MYRCHHTNKMWKIKSELVQCGRMEWLYFQSLKAFKCVLCFFVHWLESGFDVNITCTLYNADAIIVWIDDLSLSIYLYLRWYCRWYHLMHIISELHLRKTTHFSKWFLLFHRLALFTVSPASVLLWLRICK